ncbi:hypothetical protein TGRH88_037540 [Toxoplasma gondii]|uniref:Transmembrane protein n=1 Tax=Toxoplasma gondii TaxID=5811 RepID=A0A7J6K6D8_TOXGO|nr:hypothetical protein TGRH88_037540 [Toxoplasma gondii]
MIFPNLVSTVCLLTSFYVFPLTSPSCSSFAHKSVDGSSNTPIPLAASLAALVRYRRLTASLSDSHNMEGSQALGKPNLRRKLPLLAVSMFLVGMGLETAMCLSGFYSVYTVNEAKRKAEEEVREEEFWQRVRDRRAARQAAVTISSEE